MLPQKQKDFESFSEARCVFVCVVFVSMCKDKQKKDKNNSKNTSENQKNQNVCVCVWSCCCIAVWIHNQIVSMMDTTVYRSLVALLIVIKYDGFSIDCIYNGYNR